MPYPSGVITRQVIVGPFVDLTGDSIEGQVQVESPISLKWAATGALILAAPETIFLANGVGSITLPIIQQGFISTDDGLAVGKWTYVFTPILTPNMPLVRPLVLELGAGDGSPLPINFDAPNPSTNGGIIYVAGPPGAPGTNGTNGTNGTDGADSTVAGPPGEVGPSVNLTIGTVTQGAPAAATVTGTTPDLVLNLTLPKGDKGDPGDGGGGTGGNVPTGGTVGQFLLKNSSTDFDSSWANLPAVNEVPNGGATGQVLSKTTGTDQDIEWSTPSYVPVGGTDGEVLTQNSSGIPGWALLPDVTSLPTGGTLGQVLTKESSTDGDADWQDPTGSDLPTGGTTGQVLSKASNADGDVDWVDPTAASYATIPAWTTLTLIKVAGVWPDRPTSRSDVVVQWKGPDPSPAIGGTGMMDNVDIRMVTVS